MMKFDGIKSTDIREIKKALRKTVKEKQALLTREYIEYANEQICRNILGMQEYKNAQAVFCFVGTKNEINTKPILQKVLDDGKRLLVPKCRAGVLGIMDAVEITSLDQLEEGSYGILEPKESCKKVDSDVIDLAVVPCLSCDMTGARLGKGGGYYDRYFHGKLENTWVRAVVCWEKTMVNKVPRQATDQMMDLIVNEEGVFTPEMV